jgi:hypothetical protein
MKITTKIQLENFKNNFIIDFQGNENDCYNFYDWFCVDSSLKNKAIKLFKKLEQLSKTKKFDIEKTYCFFKNNCPMSGGLYDDIRICDINTGDVIYTITPSTKRRSENSISEVWGKDNDFNGPLFLKSWKEVKTFFGV